MHAVPERAQSGEPLELRASRELRPSRAMTVLEAHHRTLVVEMHERLSPETARLRYFSPLVQMPERALDRATTPEPGHCEYLGIFHERALVAMGGYHRVDEKTAEVAFLVEDAHQGNGLGTALAHRIVESAASKGMPEMLARTLPENRRIRRLLTSVGREPSTRWDDGLIEIRFRAERAA